VQHNSVPSINQDISMSIPSPDQTKSAEAKTNTASSPIRSLWPVFYSSLLVSAITIAALIYQISRRGQ
jgi:hypothetical protein